MTLLEGKVAIVTGASSGIGKAAAKLFASAGASVVVNARREELLDRLVGEIRAGGGRAVAVAGDVTNESTHQACVTAAQKEFGSLDVAFNNAGMVGEIKPFADITPQEWARVIAVNLTSAFLGARAQVPAMLAGGGGSLIFTSSFVGNSVGLPGMSTYATAKAGLMGLSRLFQVDQRLVA